MNIPKRPLLGLLLACSMPASAEYYNYPFTGYWGTDENCSVESASVKYTSIYRQFNLMKCNYTGRGRIQPTKPNQWHMEVWQACLTPVTGEDGNGNAGHSQRGELASIVLELNNHRLTERLTMDIGQGNRSSSVTEYYRCDREDQILTEETGTTDITPEHARALFERAEQRYLDVEQGNLPVPSEKRHIYRLYRTSWEAGHRQAVGGFGMATLFGYDKTGEDEQPDWDRAASLLQQGVALGDTRAMRGLAMMYWQGNGSIQRDPEKIMALYEQASALGDPKATVLLGMILTDQAHSAYHSAVSKEQSLYNAAFDFENPGIPPTVDQFDHMVNHQRGLSLLEQAAEDGHLDAWNELAEYYGAQDGEDNIERFIHYLREGAKRGHKGLLKALSDIIGPLARVDHFPQVAKAQINQCLGYIARQMAQREMTPAPELDERCPPAWMVAL